MKRTNKNLGERAKPAQQQAFKTPTQELEEFKANVLVMKHGPVIWMALTMKESDNDGRLLSEWVAMVLAPFPAILRRSFPNTPADKDSAAPLADRLLYAAMREAGSKVHELWPEYVRLLKLNPDELKAYRERYSQNRLSPDTVVRPRELRQEPGAPRKQAGRDALIYSLYKQEKKTDQQVANILEHKHGVKMSRQAVRRAYDREDERRRRQAAKLNSR